MYEEADLSNVLDELGRQFSIQLQLNTSVEGRKYTGRFSNKDLNEALQLVCLPMGLKYTTQENNVVIIEESSSVKR